MGGRDGEEEKREGERREGGGGEAARAVREGREGKGRKRGRAVTSPGRFRWRRRRRHDTAGARADRPGWGERLRLHQEGSIVPGSNPGDTCNRPTSKRTSPTRPNAAVGCLSTTLARGLFVPYGWLPTVLACPLASLDEGDGGRRERERETGGGEGRGGSRGAGRRFARKRNSQTSKPRQRLRDGIP